MKFTKMQGCENDYVYVNCFIEKVEDAGALARKVSNRHIGIGSDGLILIKPSEKADFMMEMYNADGSQGEMCGNAILCVGKYVYDRGMTKKLALTVETLAGIKCLALLLEDGKVGRVSVDMGKPLLEPKMIPVKASGTSVIAMPVTAADRQFFMTCVSMGNPHAVLFVEDVPGFNIEKYGPLLESHDLFPNKANIEFIKVEDRRHIRMRVWERGSNETRACGTGACASAYGAILNGFTEDEVIVHMLGGDLTIRFDRESGHIFMTGPAVQVFDGELFG